jgi:hypothetical protein
MTRDQKLAALAEAPQEFCLKALKDKNMHVAAKALNRLLKIGSEAAMDVSSLNFGGLHGRFGECPLFEGMQRSLSAREAALVTKVKLEEYLEEQKKELKALTGKLKELERAGHDVQPDLKLAAQKQSALLTKAVDALLQHKVPENPGWMMRCVRYAKARWNQHGDPIYAAYVE